MSTILCAALALLSVLPGADVPIQGVASVAPLEAERPYLANIVQLTSTDMGLLNAGEAYFSPDGQNIIFQATPVGATAYQIYTLNLKTRQLLRVSTGKGACTCAYYHPRGDRILFASSHLDPDVDQPRPEEKTRSYKWDFNAHMDIFEARPDGSQLRRLTEAPGYDAEGSYSPDGRFIVFTSQRDGDLEIYVMDADGSDPRRLTEARGYDGGPFFSPDGKTILFRGDRRDDDKMNLQLRLIDADGRNDRAITDNDVFNWCPFWHPSGRSIIFTQTDHAARARGERPNYDLFLTDREGRRFLRITFDPAFDGLPVFSPDGRRLMWTSQRGDLPEPQIFLADFTLPTEFQ